jgi:hypothetical protein
VRIFGTRLVGNIVDSVISCSIDAIVTSSAPNVVCGVVTSSVLVSAELRVTPQMLVTLHAPLDPSSQSAPEPEHRHLVMY